MIDTWAIAIIGACVGSVISVFAMVAALIADASAEKTRQKDAKAEAYRAGSRWKDAEVEMMEQAMDELRAEINGLEASR